MSFDAGSIKSKLTLDRSEFNRDLKQAKADGNAFARQSFKARLEVDKTRADLELAEFTRKLDEIARKRVTAHVNVNTTNTVTELHRVDQQLTGISRSAKQAKRDSEQALHPLISAAIVLGPSLIPISSGLLGISSSLVGIGTDGVLAFKGANNEIKAGTQLGAQFAAGVAQADTGLKGLEQTAARGVLTGFDQVIDKLNTKLPQLNSFVAKTAPLTGDLLSHLGGGILNLFTAATPLIVDAETALDKLASRFESWSEGPAGAKFFATLRSDIPPTMDALGNIAGTIGHTLAGLAPVGHTVLGLITGISGAINAIPIPVLVAGGYALVGWKTQSLLAAGASKLFGTSTSQAALAEERAAVAANELALAQARLALGLRASAVAGELNAAAMNSLAAASARARAAANTGGVLPLDEEGAGAARRGLLSRLAGGANAALMAGFVLRSGADATRGSENSNNLGARVASGTLDLLSSTFTRNPLHLASNIGGALDRIRGGSAQAQQNAQRQLEIIQYAHQLQLNSEYNSQHGLSGFGAARSPMLQARVVDASQLYAGSAGAAYAAKNFGAMRGAQSQLGLQIDKKAVGDVTDAYKAYQDQLQKNIETEQHWTDTSGKTVKVLGLGKVNQNLWEEALQKSNYVIPDAINLIQGHRNALDDDKNAMARAQTEQARITMAVSEAQTKYKLTADQVQLYGAALGVTNEQLGNSIPTAVNFSDAIGKVAEKLQNGNDAVTGWLGAVQTYQASAGTLADKANLLGAALTALRGPTLDMRQANLSAAGSAEDLSNAVVHNSASISKHGNLLGQLVRVGDKWVVQQPKLTKGSTEVASAMAQAGTEATNLAMSIYRNTGNARQAYSAYEGLRAQFVSTMEQAGYTADAANNLANQVYGIPKDAKTFVGLLGKNDMQTAIGDLTTAIAHLDKDIRIQLGLDPTDAASLVQSQIDRIHGKAVTVTVTGNASNQTLALLHATTGLPVRSADGNIVYAYAAGGLSENHVAQIAGRGITRVWNEPETEGEAYIPFARSKRPRSQQIAQETVARLGGVAFFASGGSYGPSLITDPVKGGGGKSSGSKQTAAQKKAAKDNSDLINRIQEVLSGLGSGWTSLSEQIRGSTPPLVAAVRSVNAEVEKAQKLHLATAKQADAIERWNKRLIRLYNERGAAQAKLAKDQQTLANTQSAMSQYGGQVRDAFLGQFDIGTSGNGYAYGIQASLHQAVANTQKFDTLRSKAKSLGLDPRLIQQLESEGQSGAANLEAIVGQGKSYVQGINKDYSALYGAASKIGSEAKQDKYGAQLAADSKAVRDDQHKVAVLTAEVNRELVAIGKVVSQVEKSMRDAAIAKKKK